MEKGFMDGYDYSREFISALSIYGEGRGEVIMR